MITINLGRRCSIRHSPTRQCKLLAAPGHKQCIRHITAHNKHNTRRRTKRPDLCSSCLRPRDNLFKVDCTACRKKHVWQNKHRRNANSVFGLCRCGRPSAQDRKCCQPCLDGDKASYERKKAKALAVKTKLAKEEQRAARRKAEGICVQCGARKAVEDRVLCDVCLKAHADRSKKNYYDSGGWKARTGRAA